MVEYVIDGSKYSFSYNDLKDQYQEFCAMSDEKFRERLHDALHFACFISWIKELPAIATISDKGIVHELIHILHPEYKNDDYYLRQVRELFKTYLHLS